MSPEDSGTRSLENFGNAYANWLRDTMHGESYEILFDLLHSFEFIPKLERDAHRCSDARQLRIRFEEESGLECLDIFEEWPASFLEVLIGLAYSIESMLYDVDYGDRTHIWFWEIMENLQLDACDDETMMNDYDKALDFVNSTVRRVINRTYEADGRGGMFPLDHSEEDQRDVELWYQANSYILERHFG